MDIYGPFGGPVNFLCRFLILILVLSKNVISCISGISALLLFGEISTKNNGRGRLYLLMKFWTRSAELYQSSDEAEAVLVLIVV